MKTILVTGASGDIGCAVVKTLSAASYRVIAVSRNKDQKGEVKNVLFETADVTDPLSIQELEKRIPEPIDWIVACHGFIDPETELSKQSQQAIEETFQTNSISQFSICQTFLPHISSGIIFISSTAGISPNGNYLAYSSSKAALNSLVEGLAKKITDKTFISICPGPTVGAMRKKIGAEGGQDPKAIANVVLEIFEGKPAYKSGTIVIVRDGAVSIHE